MLHPVSGFSSIALTLCLTKICDPKGCCFLKMQSITRTRLVKFKLAGRSLWSRSFSSSSARHEIRDVETLPQRLIPRYQGVRHCLLSFDLPCDFPVCLLPSESHEGDLLSLQWPAPPRNIFIAKKKRVPAVTEALIEFTKYGDPLCPKGHVLIILI